MFDQAKTGRFIADIRKQKGITQKDLAEQLGISDKTVSKWETGHGMPDVSVISELCEILGVSSNEMLSGEHLESAESFNMKAEENIMELMKTNKNADSRSRWSLVGEIVGLILLFAYITTMGGLNGDYFLRFIDLPSLCCVMGVIVLILVAAGRLKGFFKAIRMAFNRRGIGCDREPAEDDDRRASLEAVKTAISASLFAGLFGTLTSFMYLLTQITSPDQIGQVVAVALVTMFYGLCFAMLLIPIRERLK